MAANNLAYFTHDANGNMKTDGGKAISNIEYNHLNLPKRVTWPNGNWIEWAYDANGTKLKKTTSAGAVKHYINGIEYSGSTIEAVYHAEGRASLQSGTYRYEYTLRDHLGNSRVMFADLNGNNEVTEAEILQQNHYYPFGMNMEGSWAGGSNKYQYNGKELDNDFGLDWYHYGARMYDPAISRFTGVDPISDQFAWVTTYNYAENEPIANIDLHGLQRHKPNIQKIEKPKDLLSTKMLNNVAEGAKTMFFEMVGLISDLGAAAMEAMPDQGTPEASEFHDPDESHEGAGIEIMSNTDLNANGTTDTPGANGGSTVILETTDMIVPGDAGGAAGDAANKSTQASKTIYNLGKGMESGTSAKDSNEKNGTKYTLDTTYSKGGAVISKYKPDENNNNE